MNNEEGIVDYAQLIFKAATEAIARLRWFLLTTTLLAGLVVVNLYLGEFRAEKSQLKEVFKDDLEEVARQLARQPANNENGSAKYLSKRADSVESKSEKDKQEKQLRATYNNDLENKPLPGRYLEYKQQENKLLQELIVKDKEISRRSEQSKNNLDPLDAYADAKFRYYVAINEMDDVMLPRRNLPLLHMEVQENDYFPIVASLLMVMTAAAWLNANALEVAVFELKEALKEDKTGNAIHYFRALKLYFTFSPGRNSECLSAFLLWVALWVPFFAIFFGTGLDVYSTYLAGKGGVTPGSQNMTIHWLVLGVCIFFTFLFALFGTATITRIRDIIYQKQDREGR